MNYIQHDDEFGIKKCKRPAVVVGAPGSGKTTEFIKRLAKLFPEHEIWVFEPVKTIVTQKRADNKNPRVHFTNYAVGFGEDFFINDFMKEIRGDKSIIVIDEAHQFFFSEFRDFNVKSLKEILGLYSNKLFFITATPEVLEIYLRYEKADYDVITFPQRLKRDTINITVIPSRYSNYATPERVLGKDIILINNSKNVKKTQFLLGESDKISYIYSEFNEHNNVIFDGVTIDKPVWVGTCAMGQGLDKRVVLKKGHGQILVDANSMKQIPDIIKNKWDDDNEKHQEEKFIAMSWCAIEAIIQSDRFRMDLKTLDITVLYDVRHPEKDLPLFKTLLIDYYGKVYNNSNIKVYIDENVYEEKLDKFDFEIFKTCLDTYDRYHTKNEKNQHQRCKELLDYWCNPIDEATGKRSKSAGHYKSTLKYADAILDKYNDDGKFSSQYWAGDAKQKRYVLYYLQYGMADLLKYLMENRIKILLHNHIERKEKINSEGHRKKIIKDETKRRKKLKDLTPITEEDLIRLIKEDIEKQMHRNLALFGESLIEIYFGNLGLKYNIDNTDKGRGNNPIQMLTKILRMFIIKGDIDIDGCHVAALIKLLVGDDILVNKKLIESLYSYKAFGGEEAAIEALNYIKSFDNLSENEYNDKFGTERGLCKNTLLSAINKYDTYGGVELGNVIRTVLGSAVPAINNMDLEALRKKKSLGYLNGAAYERKWLGEYIGYQGCIYRIADGLCQTHGNLRVLDSIKEKIESTHKISISYEDTDKYKLLNIEYKTLDDFVNKRIKDDIEMSAYTDNISVFGSFEDSKNITKNAVFETIIDDNMLAKSRKYLFDTLEVFRKYAMKGATAGRRQTKRKKKKYLVIKTFGNKKTGNIYKEGTVFNGDSVPKDITKAMKRDYLMLVT